MSQTPLSGATSRHLMKLNCFCFILWYKKAHFGNSYMRNMKKHEKKLLYFTVNDIQLKYEVYILKVF